MSTYLKAILHARAGGTVTLGSKVVRFLTKDEADPILLERKPERRVVFGENGQPKTIGKGQKEQIVVEVVPQDVDPRRLGFFDVSRQPPVEFQPTEEDIFEFENGEPKLDKDENRIIRDDWVLESVNKEEIVPEVVSPETVETALAETELPPHIEHDEPL